MTAPDDVRARFEAWADQSGFGPKFRESMFAAYEEGLRVARHRLRNTVDEIDLELMGVTQ